MRSLRTPTKRTFRLAAGDSRTFQLKDSCGDGKNRGQQTGPSSDNLRTGRAGTQDVQGTFHVRLDGLSRPAIRVGRLAAHRACSRKGDTVRAAH
jgi:hypothetical protein